MKALWEQQRRVWTQRVDGTNAALFRIAVGLVILLDLLITLIPMADIYYQASALLSPETEAQVRNGYWRWSLLPLDASLGLIYAWLAGCAIAALLTAIGCFTRIATVVLFIGLISLHYQNTTILNGGDYTLGGATFLLMLMQSNHRFSVDAWWRERRGKPYSRWIDAWPVRLAQVQLMLIYCFTALLKLQPLVWYLTGSYDSIGDWAAGRAMREAMADPMLARFPSYFLLPMWISAIATWAVVLWELLFPALILMRRTRKFTLLFGLAMHIGIFLTMEIVAFSFSICAYYLLFWPRNWLPRKWRADADANDEPLAKALSVGA